MFKAGEEAIVRTTDQKVKILSRDGEYLHVSFDGETPVDDKLGLPKNIFKEDDLKRPLPKSDTYEDMIERNPRFKSMQDLQGQWELMSLLGKLNFTPKRIKWNGHWKNGSVWTSSKHSKEYLTSSLKSLGLMTDASQEDSNSLLQVIKAKKKLKTPVYIGSTYQLECSYCGEKVRWGFDGKTISIFSSCTQPDGLDTTIWELNVPSGKMVVANDLRDLFPCDEEYDINKTRGIHLQQLEYASVGMSHGFVGNTCPRVYKFPDGTIQVRTDPSDETWNGKKYVPNPFYEEWVKTFEGEKVAHVGTDLWWYSIVDADEFERRLNHEYGDKEEEKENYRKQVEYVDVKPGVYQFTQHNEANRDDFDHGCVYTDIVWVKDSDPVKNYVSEEQVKENIPETLLVQHAKAYPSLYMNDKSWEELTYDERVQAVAAVADQIMVTNGNGMDWHENGFPRAKDPGPDAERFEIPAFNFHRHWYPMSEGFSTITRAAGIYSSYKDPSKGEENMHPSWVRLALNVCASIISYGQGPQESGGKRYVKEARDIMSLAAKSYLELRKKYSGVTPVDSDFDTWMKDMSYKSWVKNFDLGPDTYRTLAQSVLTTKINTEPGLEN